MQNIGLRRAPLEERQMLYLRNGGASRAPRQPSTP